MRIALPLALLLGLSSAPMALHDEEAASAVDAPDSLLPEGWVLIGDIQVPADFASGDAAYHFALWPDGIVPYRFDANVAPFSQPQALAAMAEWEAVANVAFVVRTDEPDFIHIRAASANNSAVGKAGGQQIMNIVSWGSVFTIAHEFGHALGFWHEQSRPDRDTYVDVFLSNVQSGQGHNFDLVSGAGTFGPYDFDSLMHYSDCAFSTGCPLGQTCNCAEGTETLVALPPNEAWQDEMGQRDHLSFWDARVMSFLYPYSDWTFVDFTYSAPFGFEFGTFQVPFNSLAEGISDVPNGGTVWITTEPGYTAGAAGVYSKPMTWRSGSSDIVLN